MVLTPPTNNQQYFNIYSLREDKTMCTPSLFQAGAIAAVGKKNDREAQKRQENVAQVAGQRAATRKATVSGRRKQNIQKFSSNVASGGQKRASNVGK